MSSPHDSTSPAGSGSVPAPETGAMRCSNSDRERTCTTLHEAAGEGRLTMEETEERLGRAYAARYGHELDDLVTDLPRAAAPAGWMLVAAMARQQLVGDVAVLAGRAPGTGARRLQLLVVAIATLMLVTGAVVLLLHGVIADGPEYGPDFR